jgi:hypothetical protein
MAALQVAERRHRLAIGAAKPRRQGCRLFIAQPISIGGLWSVDRLKFPPGVRECEYSTPMASDFPLRRARNRSYGQDITEESAMNAIPIDEPNRPLTLITRSAVVVVALYVALAVGAPWLLYDAPPSAQDVLASTVYCARIGEIRGGEAVALRGRASNAGRESNSCRR